ncbi:MAG: M23 family metallopeptidase [Elusimicrobia bacterium]|nr:M23 family metallopeptidase [Elusimicrobiota bacterium]
MRPRRLKNLIFRTLLYGTSLGLIWMGMRLHMRLNAHAAFHNNRPDQGAAAYEGILSRRRLYDILRETGSDAQEATATSQALGKAINVRRLGPQDRYRVVRSTSGSFLHLTLTHELERYIVTTDDEGRFRAKKRRMALIAHNNHAAGTVENSLWLSMESAGVPAEIILRFTEIFQWTVDFLTEPRDGDRFTVVWNEHKTTDGRPWGYSIKSGAYRGAVTGERWAILFDNDYYDEKGESLRRMFLRAPLRFSRISSRFSRDRYHPVLRINRPHHGTDYAAPRGTPVHSVAGGVVIAAHRERGFGNIVTIRHNAVYTTLYGHLNKFAKGIRKGVRVKQGKVIGYVGSTGLATGPHLHFQIEKNGRWMDFLKLDLPFAHSIAKNRREAFLAHRNRIMAEIEGATASAQSSEADVKIQ